MRVCSIRTQVYISKGSVNDAILYVSRITARIERTYYYRDENTACNLRDEKQKRRKKQAVIARINNKIPYRNSVNPL